MVLLRSVLSRSVHFLDHAGLFEQLVSKDEFPSEELQLMLFSGEADDTTEISETMAEFVTQAIATSPGVLFLITAR